MVELIQKLRTEKDLSDEEFKILIDGKNENIQIELSKAARDVRKKFYGNDVYVRGLIEFTNYCKNNCYYCGIRCGNSEASRYRLDKSQILSCCDEGFRLGFRTFVLQGGEDPYYSDEVICDIIASIHERFPECAITLSIGEKSRESYKKYYDAGAQRFLLREETAQFDHYGKLHPKDMSPQNRQRCLFELKEIGYQVGCGIMVDSPFQTTDNIISDIRFMQKLEPDMIGIGPFIPHKDTPFKDMPAGSAKKTIRILSILRLLFPEVLLPATTSLGTISDTGREDGILAGANVVMPNLSPVGVRGKYLLYDGKLCTGDEAAQSIKSLKNKMESIGYHVVISRGDNIKYK